MIIVSDDGEFRCQDILEFREVLQRCTKHGRDNEIWCNGDNEEYPCIAILVSQDRAVVNYFAEEDGAMYVSHGNEQGEGIFKIETKYQVYEVIVEQVIPLKSALECAEEFFIVQELPPCIQWEGLIEGI